MPKKYPQELKERAKDYVQIHGYTFDQVAEHLDIPSQTVNGWSNRDPDGKWIKGKYADTTDQIAKELGKEIGSHPIYRTVKQRILDEITEQKGDELSLTLEDRIISENRADALIMQALSIEQFDLMALQGVQLANKKLNYLNELGDLRKVPMSEIKTYNDIVQGVKNQIHGKTPDTVINIANQQNVNPQVDYSKYSEEDLKKEFAILEQKNL